jgi:hypothetical protein
MSTGNLIYLALTSGTIAVFGLALFAASLWERAKH